MALSKTQPKKQGWSHGTHSRWKMAKWQQNSVSKQRNSKLGSSFTHNNKIVKMPPSNLCLPRGLPEWSFKKYKVGLASVMFKFTSSYLHRCFLISKMQRDCPGILLKCRFWFDGLEWSEFLLSSKLPGNIWTIFWVVSTWCIIRTIQLHLAVFSTCISTFQPHSSPSYLTHFVASVDCAWSASH